MKYKSFEDLPVWQAAIELARHTYAVTENEAFRGHAGLRDQLERASLSVSNNIAEGFERGSTSELLAFLYIARGSAGEVRSILCVLEGLTAFENLKSQIADLEIAMSQYCAAAVWLDRTTQKLRHHRSTAFERQRPHPHCRRKRPRRVSRRTRSNPPIRPQALRNMKSEI